MSLAILKPSVAVEGRMAANDGTRIVGGQKKLFCSIQPRRSRSFISSAARDSISSSTWVILHAPAPHYSHTGRPSIDPELMIRMLLVGYCYGIRSERRLCEEVDLNLAYRWFCRLGLGRCGPRPFDVLEEPAWALSRGGHSAPCLRDNGADVHGRRGLVGGEGFAADASIIRANANRQNSVPGGDDHDWTGGPGGEGPSRPVREYLAALDQDAALPKEISLSDPASRLTAASANLLSSAGRPII